MKSESCGYLVFLAVISAAIETAGFGLLVSFPFVLIAELSGRDTVDGLIWAAYSSPIWAPVLIGDAIRRVYSRT